MAKLVAAFVTRSGRTARYAHRETSNVSLENGSNNLYLTFSLSSKGGGITDVSLHIGPSDFAALAEAMVEADRGHALAAMADRLAEEIAKQSDYDKKLIRKGRESVIDAAYRDLQEAPEDRNDAELLTRNRVRQLVTRLNASDEDEPEDTDSA